MGTALEGGEGGELDTGVGGQWSKMPGCEGIRPRGFQQSPGNK